MRRCPGTSSLDLIRRLRRVLDTAGASGVTDGRTIGISRGRARGKGWSTFASQLTASGCIAAARRFARRDHFGSKETARLPQSGAEGPTPAGRVAKAASDRGQGAQLGWPAEPPLHTPTGDQGNPGSASSGEPFRPPRAGRITGDLRWTRRREPGTLRAREWARQGPKVPGNAPEQGTGGHRKSPARPQRDDS